MISTFYPAEISPDTHASIVLMNHVGSRVCQDTGRDAAAMSKALGAPVIAVNRPGTETFYPSRHLAKKLSTPEDYMEAMVPIAVRVNRVINDLGSEAVLVTGRSAGAVGALALASADTLVNLKAVVAIEPVAIEKMSISEGKKKI